MKQRLDLVQCPYYFQFTLNPYGQDLERYVPSKREKIIPAFIELSQKLGKHRVLWRYDPIVLSKKYTMDYHKTYFEELMKRLHPYTAQCTISFLDYLSNTYENTKELHVEPENKTRLLELVDYFSQIAQKYGVTLFSCGEELDLSAFGIKTACCIDKNLLERQVNHYLEVPKDRNQREFCTCDVAIDLGMYDSCVNGCMYCYANKNHMTAKNNYKQHDSSSPFLYGKLTTDDVIKKRVVVSYQCHQQRLF